MNEYTKIISLAKLCNIFLNRERHQGDRGHSQQPKKVDILLNLASSQARETCSLPPNGKSQILRN